MKQAFLAIYEKRCIDLQFMKTLIRRCTLALIRRYTLALIRRCTLALIRRCTLACTLAFNWSCCCLLPCLLSLDCLYWCFFLLSYVKMFFIIMYCYEAKFFLNKKSFSTFCFVFCFFQRNAPIVQDITLLMNNAVRWLLHSGIHFRWYILLQLSYFICNWLSNKIIFSMK